MNKSSLMNFWIKEPNRLKLKTKAMKTGKSMALIMNELIEGMK